ncbi:MAG: prohibitin family protein [Clostridiales bacterium]|nr:prohibitin family protein [Clostridiales bacterium]
MVWVAAALILAVVVFIITGFSVTRKEVTDKMGNTRVVSAKTWKTNRKSILAVLPLLLIIVGCISTIPAGHTGVLVTFGRVEDKILNEGVNFKLPYQQVIKMDNRVQKRDFAMEAFSSDIQQTSISGSVNFTVDKTQSQFLYQNVGVNYYDTVIYPRVLENVKLVFSAYSAEGLVEKRTVLSDSVEEYLTEDMSRYGIQIIDVNIENIDFTDTFTDAVEAKQVAQQNKLTTQTEQEAAIIVAQAEAEKKVIAANAEAETAKIAAEAEAYAVKIKAEAEAKANADIAASLTDELIDYTKITNWNGVLPQVQMNGGEGVYPVIELPASNSSNG